MEEGQLFRLNITEGDLKRAHFFIQFNNEQVL
jgi:hypothetical protein